MIHQSETQEGASPTDQKGVGSLGAPDPNWPVHYGNPSFPYRAQPTELLV